MLTRQIARVSLYFSRFLFCHFGAIVYAALLSLFYIQRLPKWKSADKKETQTKNVHASISLCFINFRCSVSFKTNRFGTPLICVWWMVILKDLGQREPWTYFKAFDNGSRQQPQSSIIIKMGETKLFFLSHTHICLLNAALIRTALIIVAQTNFSSFISKRSGYTSCFFHMT